MNSRTVLGYLLLLFAVGSLVVFLVRDIGDRRSSVPRDDAAARDAAELPPSAKLIVYYFDEGKDCSTCLNIPEYTQDALKAHFAQELASGDIVWRSVDVEEARNAHFITEYELYTKSVVLVRVKDGKQAHWQNLDAVWDLVYDKDAFIEYVRKKIQDELDTPT